MHLNGYFSVIWKAVTLLTLTLNSYSPRECELAGLYCIYVFGMPMKDWQQRLMGKAMTVTDTKTLWGKDPDKRNPCFTSICLNYSDFRVQSYLHSQFLHIFVWTIKSNTWGALPYKPVWDMPFFRHHFSA